ncbi:hypothetical protein A6S26_27840 [Nostoc sp. ATCC 43529]|nr:hypothetical protein A6S26_27840 [Nostoc sp. ATCC 43529]
MLGEAWGKVFNPFPFFPLPFKEPRELGQILVQDGRRLNGSDADFDRHEPLTADDEARIRMKNAPILQDLYSCDGGLSPTSWQHQQFPSEYHNKIKVLHDGIDTEFFSPKRGAKLILPRIHLDLTHAQEIVNGLLVDFFSPQEICDRITKALTHSERSYGTTVAQRTFLFLVTRATATRN